MKLANPILDRPIRKGALDRVAMALSAVCLVHCLATALLVGLLSTLGGLLGSPLIHEVGLAIAVVLGAIALGRGVREHGRFLPPSIGGLGLGMMGAALMMPHGGYEAIVTMMGVALLALGHYLNRLALV